MQRRAPSSSKSGVPTTGGSVRGNVVAGLSWVRVRRKANIFGRNLVVEGVMVRGGRAIFVLGGGGGVLVVRIEKMGDLLLFWGGWIGGCWGEMLDR